MSGNPKLFGTTEAVIVHIIVSCVTYLPTLDNSGIVLSYTSLNLEQ